MTRIPLEEEEKLTIVRLVERSGKKWQYISTFLPGRTVPTIKRFCFKY